MGKIMFRFISFLLILVLIIQSSLFCVFAETKNIFIGGNCNGRITVSDNSSYDFSNVKINIYKLVVDNHDETGENYNHVYYTSVYPDNDGNILFKRPSEYCYVEIELDSLDDRYGARILSSLIKPGEVFFNLEISKVDGFDVDIIKNNVVFFDQNKNILTVEKDYKIDYNISDKNDILKSKSIDVFCNIGNWRLKKKIDLSSISYSHKIDFLFYNNIISKKEFIDYYLDLAETKDSYEKSMALINHIYSFVNESNITSNQQNRIDNLRSLSHIDYNDEGVYSRGFFSIHYENGQVSTNLVKTVYNAFNYVRNELCNMMSFNSPVLETGETRYHIYIINYSLTGSTPPVNVGAMNPISSYIKLNQNKLIQLYNDSDIAGITSIVCHEFTHAVQYSYIIWNNYTTKLDLFAFNEAVSCQMAMYLVPSNPSFTTNPINILNYPNVPVFYDPFYDDIAPGISDYSARRYSLAILALYIVQEHTVSAIRKIYENYSISNDFFTALQSALGEYNTNISDLYLDFMAANYDTEANYSFYNSTWQRKPTIITPPYYTDSNSNTTHFLPDLSTCYYELNSTNRPYNSNTFTFHLSDDTDLSKAYLYKIYTNGSGVVSTQKIPFTSRVRTVTSNLYNETTKVCVFISNSDYGNTYSSFYNPEFEYTVDVR